MDRRPQFSRRIFVKSRTGGFTLIELMIVVAVIAVIAAVAMPSYFGSIRKSRRSEAVAVMAQIQQAQERWRASCPSYATLIPTANAGDCNTGTSGLAIAALAGARYTYALPVVSATGYTLTATATASGGQLKDTGCTVLTMTVAAGLATQTPPKCWSQ
jgi:type IV pilus assembly protein PilE